MKLSKPIVIMDLETTGTWIEKDRIIEIGMIKRLEDGTRKTYLKRVNPGMKIPAKISRLIGITDEDVREAPPFKLIASEVLNFIGASDLAGFNVERFDLPLLERECYEAGLKFDWKQRKVYDTQKIYHVHEKRDLRAAYKFYCALELENAHTAIADAEAAWAILAAQHALYGGGREEIEALGGIDYEMRIEYFDPDRKFRWWNEEIYPSFGKYSKTPLREIVQKDPAYLRWMVSADFSEEVKELVKNALEGKFPQGPLPVETTGN